MVCDRLPELQAASKHTPDTDDDNEEVPLMEAERNLTKEEEEETKESLKRLADVNIKVDEIKTNTKELAKVFTEILTSIHRDEKWDLRKEDLQEENTKMAADIRNTIKREHEAVQKIMNSKKLSDKQRFELRMRRTQVAAMTKRFSAEWEEYNRVLMECKEKRKRLLVKRCKIANSSYSQDQIETMLDEGNSAVFAKGILNEEQLAKKQLSELEDQHDKLIKLEKSIKEVHDMFIGVAELVQQQDNMMDNIARHVEDSGSHFKKWAGYLERAERSQRSARKKKMIGLLGLFCCFGCGCCGKKRRARAKAEIQY